MAATLGHLVAGDLVAAEAAMATVADGELVPLDPTSFWQPFRTANFSYGEARLAPLLKACYPDNLWWRLRGVDCLIATGATDAAVQELQLLVAMEGAFAHAGHFLDAYRRLGRFDLCSAFAQAFAGDGTRPKADRAHLGFEVAGVLRAHDLRGPLFHELQRMKALCADDLPLTVQLAEFYISIGERSAARDALSGLPAADVATPLVKLYLLQLAPVLDRDELAEGLRRLAAEPSTDSGYWIRFSYVATEYGDPALALEATRKAVAHAPEQTVWLRIRMAQVLKGVGQLRAAISEIEGVVADDQAMRFSGQTLGDLAVDCGRPALAVRIAQRWLALSQADMQAHLMHCVYQRKAGGDGLRAAAAAALQAVQEGAPFTAAQFRLLADCVRGTDGALETALAKAAAAQHPGVEEFRSLARPDAFTAKFLAAGPAPQASGQGRRWGFFGRGGRKPAR